MSEVAQETSAWPLAARTILVRQHIDHAVDAQRLARVDAHNSSLGDRRCNHAAMGEVRGAEFAGIFRRTGDLGVAVDAGCGRTDIRGHNAHRIFLSDCDCGVPFAAWVKARTMARRARSILKLLCSKPLASRSKKSAARMKLA